MKKIFASLLILSMTAALLAGCGKNPEESSAESSSETAESVTESVPESEDGSASESRDESIPEYDFDAENPEYSKYLDDNGHIQDVRALDFVKLPDFSQISYEKASLEADEETIEVDISNLLGNFKTADTNEAYIVQDGDTLNIDYTGSVDGVEFEGGSTKGNGTEVTIGVTNYIDGFLDQLVGHHIGETFDINVTFPDSYPSNPDLEGKPAVFRITLNSVLRTPELSQELIDAHLDEIRAYFNDDTISNEADIREFLYNYHVKYNLENLITEEITENDLLEFSELPENALKLSEHMMDIMTYNYYQVTFREFAAMVNYTEEDIRSAIERDAKMYLFVQAMAEEQGITADDDYLIKMTNSGSKEAYQDIEDFYGRGYIMRYALEEQVYEYLHGIVQLIETAETE